MGFERDPQIDAWVDEIYQLAGGLGRGDTLTRAAIKAVLGCEPNTGPWGHVMRRVRARLERERGITCWPVREVGFRLLPVAEHAEVPQRRLRRARRQVRRGRVSLQALPDAALSVHMRRVKAETVGRLRETEADLLREERGERAELRPTPPSFPRRPPPDAAA